MYVVTPDIEQAYTVSHAIHVHESCIHVSGEGSALKCIHFLLRSPVEENNQLLAMKPVGLVSILVPARNRTLSFFINESIATLWPDGVPHDGTPREVTNYSLIPLMAVCYIYATIGIFFAIVCLFFNIIFRNKK